MSTNINIHTNEFNGATGLRLDDLKVGAVSMMSHHITTSHTAVSFHMTDAVSLRKIADMFATAAEAAERAVAAI